MISLENKIEKILVAGTVVSGIIMVTVVMIQVISRFALPFTPPWTEEAARISLIYMISFSAGLAIKENAYINVDVVQNLLPVKIRQIFLLLNQLLILVLMAVISIQSLKLVNIGAMQKSPALQIPMSFFFFSIFLMAFSIMIFSLLLIIREVAARFKSGTPA